MLPAMHCSKPAFFIFSLLLCLALPLQAAEFPCRPCAGVRLESVTPVSEIARLLKAGGEMGKRLDFLIQELHREANTLGSKASALELTQISVEMKVLIEQMREQVQNIE